MCLLRFLAWAVEKLHWLHLFGFSPLCTFMWSFKLLVWESKMLQRGHFEDFLVLWAATLVCVLILIISSCRLSCYWLYFWLKRANILFTVQSVAILIIMRKPTKWKRVLQKVKVIYDSCKPNKWKRPEQKVKVIYPKLETCCRDGTEMNMIYVVNWDLVLLQCRLDMYVTRLMMMMMNNDDLIWFRASPGR